MGKILQPDNTLHSDSFENIVEPGFNIERCCVDYKSVSVRCSDIVRYKKAFRVKIRRLIKRGDIAALSHCIDTFFCFATFVEYLYGHHSCAIDVEPWQEETALSLQQMFSEKEVLYTKGTRLVYAPVHVYERDFKRQYSTIFANMNSLMFVQDTKPFLTLKDYAHFERWYRLP
jgi:hypothetical protein